MIISKLSFKILDPSTEEDGITLLKKIEYIARVSHRTEDRVTEDSYDRFLRSVVLNHGDFSVIEHATATVELELDRGLSHEWVRHRIGAYTQESTRFVNYSKVESGARYIQPPFTVNDSTKLLLDGTAVDSVWYDAIVNADNAYREMLENGIAPQLARSVLPNSLATKLVVTYNLRSWRHFFIMRTSKETHPQMKEITIPLLTEFQRLIPILYEDIIPDIHQATAMRLLR